MQLSTISNQHRISKYLHVSYTSNQPFMFSKVYVNNIEADFLSCFEFLSPFVVSRFVVTPNANDFNLINWYQRLFGGITYLFDWSTIP